MRNTITVIQGQRFGRLTVIREAERQYGHRYILCRCDCGNEKAINLNSLVHGTSTSCGCYRREFTKKNNSKHGFAKDGKVERLYYTWINIKRRCYDPKVREYHNYGERGITVCDEWRNDYSSFRKWAYDNGYDDTKTRKEQSIDRIDNNKGYSPDNCRWTTMAIQSNNTRVNHKVTYMGETHTLSEWQDITGIDDNIIGQRLRKGLPLDKVFYKGDLRAFRYKEKTS